MPGHRFHSALIGLSSSPCDPWSYPQWQELTSVSNGLFPLDDAKLPGRWTRDEANSISSFFSQFAQKNTEDDRIKFALTRGCKVANVGRDKWFQFCTNLWKRGNLHAAVVGALTQSGAHPRQVMQDQGLVAFPCVSDWAHYVLDKVSRSLLGSESLDSSGRALMPLRTFLNACISRTWDALRSQDKRFRGQITLLEQKAVEAVKGK